MFSIYHFYKSLIQNKNVFFKLKSLEQFPFDKNLLASQTKGKFSDLSIKLNQDSKILTGGELIELKDSESYTVSSFNSTIPTGTKKINDIFKGKNSTIKKQMEKAGNKIESLAIREVFYLVRGKNKLNDSQKIVLIHGSFFEILQKEELISQSFLKVLEERLKETDTKIKSELKTLLTSI